MGGKIARTRREAEIGDLLWVWDGDVRQADMNWRLEQVRKQGRGYVFVGLAASDVRRWRGYDLESGAAQSQRGYSPNKAAFGFQERQDWEWRGKSYEMARALERVADIEMLKAVGHILGIDTPKLHDTSPDPLPLAGCTNDLLGAGR